MMTSQKPYSQGWTGYGMLQRRAFILFILPIPVKQILSLSP